MTPALRARVAKAFRVRGTGTREVYFRARKVARFFRDGDRRQMLANLGRPRFHIPRADGFLLLAAGTFEETPAIIRDACAALSRFDAAQPPDGKNRKRFLQNVLDASMLTRESPMIRLALREDVLVAVSRYLGVVPFLSNISVFHSDTVDAKLTSSQLYHCDGDDITQLKLWVYCSDVDARSGPLTVLDADATREVQRRTKYQFRQRLTDAQVHAVVGTSHDHPIVGPAGTTAFVDTSRCFHFGSRVQSNAPARLAVMLQYQTPYSFMLPPGGEEALPFRGLVDSSLSPLQRLVLGARLSE
jgi:hypothetical protein